MINFKIILSFLFALSFNSQSSEFRCVAPINARNVIKGLLGVVAIYAGYQLFSAWNAKRAKKAEESRIIAQHNSATISNFKINEDTIIAFDLHDVMATYDVSRMIKKALSKPRVLFNSLRGEAGVFKIIYNEIRNGSATQQIFEVLKSVYPQSSAMSEAEELGIDMSAQLRPIQGTIDIATKLMNNGYKVVFMSNIEPKLWDRFIKDFPVFSTCQCHIPSPENNWLKKPSPDYFNGAKVTFGIEGKPNILFIDDRFKFVKAADQAEIPAYVFTNPAQLKNDLIAMGAHCLC
jgi:FMN phosphatase YigB (HAD superfamily)